MLDAPGQHAIQTRTEPVKVCRYLEGVRASRLIELLLILQVRGAAPAVELARHLEVSTRTIYRDVEALSVAGVPVYAETGRGGGIRLADGYRTAGLPKLADNEAQSLVLAAMPSVAADLGLEGAQATEKLFSALDPVAEVAARSVRERLLVEAEPWWRTQEPVPHLVAVAEAVFRQWEIRVSYRRSGGGEPTEAVLLPLGLVLKGGTWYVVARRRSTSEDRLYRVSRITEVVRSPHRFERPKGFELERAWQARKEAFAAGIPRFEVRARVTEAGRHLVHLLQEGTPRLPLPDPDDRGWTTLSLRFERIGPAARLLLQLGAEVEVLEPGELRELIRAEVGRMQRLYP